DDVAAVIAAEVTTAATVRERMAALWRNAADHPTGGRRWLALEHELWSYASRHDEARRHLARRYQEAWEAIDASSATWSPTGTPAPPGRVGPALVGLLLGLEMMRRVDPGAVTDELAVAALCGVVQGTSEGALT
ncbi:MAG TPA: hypothetical protein VF743_01820, partial [Acidimicrobiales bacterium]